MSDIPAWMVPDEEVYIGRFCVECEQRPPVDQGSRCAVCSDPMIGEWLTPPTPYYVELIEPEEGWNEFGFPPGVTALD